MTADKRFLYPQIIPTLIILLTFLIPSAISCSGGGNSTVTPPIYTDDPFPISVQDQGFSEGHNIFGMCTIDFDPIAQTAQVRLHRTVEEHWNLTGFLSSPNCPDGSCLTWYITGFDPIENIFYIDMNLVNPTALLAYDMRVLFMGLPFNEETEEGWEVVNPDSYCTFYDDDPLWDEDEQWLNPFIAFEKEDQQRQFLPDPDGTGDQIYSDTEILLMYVPPGSGGGEITIILDGNWPSHCPEPYEISHFKQSDDLQPGNSVLSVVVECVVADWQEDFVSVSLYMPDIISDATDGYIEMDMWPTTGQDAWPPNLGDPPWTPDELLFLMEFGNYDPDTLRKFFCTVTNENEVLTGTYPAVVIAESIDPFWSGNPDDENFDRIYNIYPFEIDIGGSGGDPNQLLQITYSSYRNDNDSDIWTYYFLAGEHIRLTNSGSKNSDEIYASMAQTATQLVFASNWNKDTQELDDFEIYTLNINYFGEIPQPALNDNTGEWQQQTFNNYDDLMPDWSPNATRIAYCADELGQFEIYTLIPNTPGSRQRVTVNYASDEAPHYDRSNTVGTHLYYQANRPGGDNYEIYSINPTMEESSMNLPSRWTFDIAFDGYPSTRGSDGDMAWTTNRFGPLEILYTDFTDTFRLTNNEANDMYPSFSVNGQWIAFTSDRVGGNMDIWRMTWKGENPSRMTHHELPDFYPCYAGGE